MIRTMVAIIAMLALLTGCGGGGDEGVADQSPATDSGTAESPGTGEAPDGAADPAGDADAEAEGGDEVLVQGFRFQPERLEVAAGATVTWTNEDDIAHTATAGTPDAPSGEFDVDLDGVGATGTHTFDAAGTYAYFCEVHNSMLGEIVVS